MNNIRAKIIEHINNKILNVLPGKNIDRIISEGRMDENFFIGVLMTEPSDKMQGLSQTRTRRKQIGIDVLINKKDIGNIKFEYTIEGFFFYRVFPTLDEQREYYMKAFNARTTEQVSSYDALTTFLKNNPSIEKRNVRVAPVYQKIMLKDEKILYQPIGKNRKVESMVDGEDRIADQCIKNLKDTAQKSHDYFYVIREDVCHEDLKDKNSWTNFIERTKKEDEKVPLMWDFDFGIEEISYGKDKFRISFTWSNLAPESNQGRSFQSIGTNVNEIFDCKIKLKIINGSLEPIKLKEFSDDYKYDRKINAIGKNCFVEEDKDNKIYSTNSYPSYKQYKLKVRQHNLKLTFNELAVNPLQALESIADAMDEQYNNFDSEVSQFFKTKALNKANYQKEIAKEKKDFLIEKERYKYGIEILTKYDDIKHAFILMNKSFSEAQSGFDSWYLFQIVFIVSLIPDIASNKYQEIDAKYKNLVDLLYFPTGGGKTEAFLGLIIFNLFFDRLRGKNLGITSILKYPLRLLSIQQMQRIADAVGAAEKIRRKTGNLQESGEFSVGYFVGEANTPNKIDKERASVLLNKTPQELTKEFLILEKCPFCQQKGVIIRYLEESNRLSHFCPNCDAGNLPIYIVDREIYRYLPSVIISTIDKFAGIGTQRNIRNIFGNISAKCPIHGFTSQSVCTEGGFGGTCNLPKNSLVKIEDKNLAPTLLVQDELHLLLESLGIFDAHYETFIINYLSKLTPSKTNLKIIAASATISQYQRHIEHLYLKEAVRFPAASPDPNKSFYYEIDKNELNRIFIGIAPYGITPKLAVHKISEALRNCIWEYYEAPVKLNEELGLKLASNDIKTILRDYWIILEYNQKKSDTLDISDTLAKTINPKITVDNKKFDCVTLTGDTRLEEVRSIVSEIEDESKPLPSPNFIAATSMISHGVDIDILNLMILYAVPQTIGEYIQASSRVGRKYPASVFLIFITNREKDKSYYKYFKNFNEYKDILIEPVAINRWVVNAVDRTLPGLFFGLMLLHFDYVIQQKHQQNIYMVKGFQEAIKNGWLPNADQIADMLLEFYGANTEIGQLYAEKIREKIRYIYKRLTEYSSFKDEFIPNLIDDFLPMRSLRDTETNLEIEHPDTRYPMKRGIMQLFYKHFPCSWIYYDKSRFEKDVSFIDCWDSRENRDINAKRLLWRIGKRIRNFLITKNIDSELDTDNCVILRPLRARASSKAQTFFCTKCKRAFKKNFLHNNECPYCKIRAKQMPLVFACECGWTGSVELIPCKIHGYEHMKYREGKYDQRSWVCGKCPQSYNVRRKCPECGKFPLYPKNIGDSSVSIARTCSMIDLIESKKERALEKPNGQDLIYASWLGLLDCKEENQLFDYILKPKEQSDANSELIEKEISEYIDECGLNPEQARKVVEKKHGIGNKIAQRLTGIREWIQNKVNPIAKDTHFENTTSILEYGTLLSLKESTNLKNVSILSKKLVPTKNQIDLSKIAKQYGFIDIRACSNIPMITSAYGYSRREFDAQKSVLIGFPPDREVQALHPGKKNIYAHNYETEGIVFEISRKRILEWLLKNKIVDPIQNNLPNDLNNEEDLKLWFINNIRTDLLSPFRPITKDGHRITYYLHTLVHTISHILLRNAESLCGLDKNSLKEYLFPIIPSFIIYSLKTHDFPLGAFFNLFAASLPMWLENAFDACVSCINDPICINHMNKDINEDPNFETASCYDCLYVNEISCQHFNYNLDRKLLTGESNGNARTFHGFWDKSE